MAFSSEFITTQILEHLSGSGYNLDEIISQCNDGAALMSGLRWGSGLVAKEGREVYSIYPLL